MDLSKRLGLDADLLKAATKVLEGKKTETKEEPKTVKEETQHIEYVICVIDRHGKDTFLEGFTGYSQVLSEASKLRKSGSWKRVEIVNLSEFQDTTGVLSSTAPARTTSLASRVGRFLARRAAGVAGLVVPDNNTPDSNSEREALRQAMTPDQRARYDADREANIRDTAAREAPPRRETLDIPDRQPEAQTQAQPETRRDNDNIPAPPPEPPARPEPQRNVTAASTPRREQPRAQDNDNVADRLNAISLGQTVADRGGTPEADAAPRDDKERDAAQNMRRRRSEINNEETIVEKEEINKNKKQTQKSKSPGVVFQPETPVNEEVGGKIKSSKRITKALQDIINKGVAKDFKFEDGTTIKIEPSMARIALQKYNALNDFQRAKAAKTMRKSYKDFLVATRGH